MLVIQTKKSEEKKMGILILVMLIGLEIGMLVFRIRSESNQSIWKNRIRIGTFIGMLLFTLVQIIKLSFRWYLLYIVLLIQAIVALVYLWRLSRGKVKEERPYKVSRAVIICVRRSLGFMFLLLPAILFPQFKDLPVTGEYDVLKASYTLEDKNRTETYLNNNQSRKLTIEFWYPDALGTEKEFPLIIFSHGAFGFRGSNYSTFMELASNGYVVCSIDHTYQSFFTSQTDGKVTIVDQDFLNDALAVQSDTYDIEKSYVKSHEWLDIRTADMNFVIDTILTKVDEPNKEEVFKRIDPNNIGAFGHSLGGATAAQIGRIREDIDAVIVLDGTMIGEVTSLENGIEVINDSSYPIPILDIFNEEHYRDGLESASTYANMVTNEKAVNSIQTVFIGSGHLNFTDLPLFSPLLAGILGTGDIDSRYCIETTNQIVLSYFDYYLKGTGELDIQSKY